MNTKKLTFTKVDKTKRYNMIDPDGTNERCGEEKMNKEITDKWQFTKEDDNGCGNVNSDCSFDIENGKVIWDDTNFSKRVGLTNLISSPLLLYRLICLFSEAPEVPSDPYKSIWWYHIKHKKSKKVLGFGEWKGASGFWLPETSHTKLNVDFKKDLEELLLFIISDQIAHPYDGCTAGQIA